MRKKVFSGLLALVLVFLLMPSASAAVSPELIDNPVPFSYLSKAPSEQQGAVHQESYTVTSGSHASLTKYIYVYLPAEYESNPQKRYDIFYFMHGLGGTAYELLGEQFNNGQIKNMIDHMIADKIIDPIIIVAVTWNTNPNLSGPNSSVISSQGGDAERQAFHTEFEEDVMPLIESKYRTYARSTSTADLIASREHRGFGGFSYGAHTTWYQLRSDVDYIYYFAPMSGGLSNLYAEIARHRQDYQLCCITGTNDNTRGQCDTHMALYPGGNNNISYYKVNGATHSYTGYQQYLYTALREFYAPVPFSDAAALTVEGGGYSYYVSNSTLRLKITDTNAAVIVAQYDANGRQTGVEIETTDKVGTTFDVTLTQESYKIFSVNKNTFAPRCAACSGR